MIKGLAKLEKLKITAYRVVERKRSARIGSFQLMFNPESIQRSFSSNFRQKQAINSSGKEAIYMFSQPHELNMTLIIDSTAIANVSASGLAASAIPLDIIKEVDKFKKLTYDMNGKIHEPNFLKLSWTGLDFNCRLKSFAVTYSNYKDNGRPIRAEIDATFIHEEPQKTRKKLEGKSSPDLTHKRVVRDGDKLPLLTKEIYGNADHYLMVARFNGLNNFRELKTGQVLYFPPIKE